MTETNERVTVDFDEQSYYLDGEYWESWDNYGEEMADAINKLLNELAEENQQLKHDLELLNSKRIQKQKYSSKKYNDYPIIIDNESEIELSLDSVVKILNDYTWQEKNWTKEQYRLHEKIDYITVKLNMIKSKNKPLKLIILVLLFIICIETLQILTGVI